MNLSRPTDSEHWALAVQEAYKLRHIQVENIHFNSSRTLTGTRHMATAAFATDGGDGEFTNNPEKSVAEIIGALNQNGLAYALVKARAPLQKNVEHCFLDDRYFSFILPIVEGEKYVWDNLIKAKTRNQIRKSQKYGFSLHIGGHELIEDCDYVLSRVRKSLGSPTHSPKFYLAIMNQFVDSAKIMILRDKQVPVSAAILFSCNDTIHHPLAATLHEYRNSCANNLLYLEIIRYGIAKGLKYFDMGRSHPKQGTFNYKKSWGACEYPLYYYYVTQKQEFTIPQEGAIAHTLSRVWTRLPLGLTRKLGPILYPAFM